MPKCRWDIDWESYLTSRHQHDQHKQFSQSFARDSQKQSPFNISGLTFQEGQQFPLSDLAQIYTPQLIGNNSWLGTVPGNISKSSWEQGQKKSWEQNLLAWDFREQNFLMWPKMRVCATFPGTNGQVPGNQGHLSTSAMTGQRHFWSDQTSKSFSGVWDCRLCLFDDVLCCRGGDETSTPIKRPPQLLWESSSNHASAASWSQCVQGRPFLFCPSTATGTPEKITLELTGQRWGAKMFCFCIVPTDLFLI